MSEQRKFCGLKAQLLAGVLLSLMAAGLVFLAAYVAGNKILDHTVYGKAFMSKMADRQFSQLEDYVQEQEVTSRRLRPLDIWCSWEEDVYLSLYVEDQIIYESERTSKDKLDPEEYDPEEEDPKQEYQLTLSDGTRARAFLYYYTGEAYYYGSIVIAGVIAFFAFCLCFISFIHRKLQYIEKLEEELGILAGGDLSYQVTVKGKDELSQLAQGIDEMRRSIAAHQEEEEKIRTANSELVTAMSHDLRTPLTSLLAYLEMLDRRKYQDEEQLRHFISRSLEKTFQIKSMADKLFEYFLVYSSEWEKPISELVDADELFSQMWGEYEFALESKEFMVACDFAELGGKLRINMDLLQRAFDNLYSNLLKYADPALPVDLSYRREGSSVHLTVSNSILAQKNQRESTNIGLNTCSRIIRYHGGSFSAGKQGDRFFVSISLPLEE